jgi:putative inorganic carbon (HCO3(-)) transporter
VTVSRARRSAAWLVLPAAAAAAVVVAGAVAGHLGSGTKPFTLLAAGSAGFVALIAAAVAVDVAWILSIGVALSIFSGNWSYIHIPVPLDRVVIFTGIATVLVRSWVAPDAPRVPVRRIHLLLAFLALYAIASSAAANTLTQHEALFELLDRLGIVPFLLYLVAPAAFATERQRTILLWTLTVVGAYLGATAFFEMVGPHSLVFPSYISNPALGLHDGRARGPFLEAGSDGLAMFCCAVAATVLFGRRAQSRRLRYVLGGVVFLCLLGVVLTLTRESWLAAAVGGILAALASPRLRRFVPIGMLVTAVAVGGALVVIPGLRAKVDSRATTQNSLWDRYNSDAAALRMFESRPLLGFGWGSFPTKSPAYYHVARTYPLSAVQEVHNVTLSNAAEIGAVGVVLWLIAVVMAAAAPWRRRGPPALEPWKWALIAVVVAWFVQGNFAPVSYAFDNYLPWLFAGVAFGLPAPAEDDPREWEPEWLPPVGRPARTPRSPTYA